MEDSKEEIKLYLAKHRSWVGVMLGAVNLMDGRCRQMLMSNPSRPITHYCEKCQKMLKEKLESALK